MRDYSWKNEHLDPPEPEPDEPESDDESEIDKFVEDQIFQDLDYGEPNA